MTRRLESIELHGIKTFATTTRLEFPGQVTAIVGPNGSGKSNIADSIRWVLGEQSFSSIRAKKTEDIIFSGSQQRSRAGMASATITFNNEEGWLPIDYSEVSISRRAYRDGQNEYLLNGQRVRLKDISELLAQTGLAERTYTIIGQGLVDVALALKPDERRKLFEEAAGIGLYQSRKDESLRRLENTQKNLDRVLDILAEIRPRLRSLEKQSKRFEEFQRLRIDLEQYLNQWYGYHWHTQQHKVTKARETYKTHEIVLVGLRNTHQEIVHKVEESRTGLQENRKALEEAHQELSKIHQELQQANRDLAILEERQRSHTHQKSNLEIDIANTQEEIKGLESQENEYQNEISKQLQELQSAIESHKSAKLKLEDISTKRDETQKLFEETRNKRIRLETEKVQFSARIEELHHRNDSLNKEISKIENAIKDIEIQKADLSVKIISLEKDLENRQVELDKINNLCDEKIGLLESYKSDRDKLDQEIAKNETDRTRLSTQLDVLIQAQAALSGYSKGSKTLVDDSRIGKLPKGIEPIAQHLIVEEKYEKAISSALGELTDLLVVPLPEANVVIEYLETKEHDRVALFMPDDDLRKKTRTKEGMKDFDGFIGYANELIDIKEPYHAVVNTLFSDILVVKDRHSAKRIQSELVGNQRAVTLSGMVFLSNGVVISGQSQSGKRIGRTRQQNEIQKSVEEISGRLGKLSDKRNKIETKIQNLQKTISGLNEEQQNAENMLNQALNSVRVVKESLSRLEEQLRWHKDRMEEIGDNLMTTSEHLHERKNALNQIDEKIFSILNEEKQISLVLDDYPLFEAQQEVNQLHTLCVVAENALKATQIRFDDHHHRLLEAQNRLMTYQARLRRSQESSSEVQNTESNLKEQIEELRSKISQLESEKIEPLSMISSHLEQDVASIEKQENQHHQHLINAERLYTQLQLEMNRSEDQLKNLREHIESDFGLVLFDYEDKIEGPTPLPFEDGFVKTLPHVQELADSTEEELKRLKTQIRRIGAINPEAQKEYFDVKERFEFLTNQVSDLEKASQDLHAVINELDTLMEKDFISTFKAVNTEFGTYFTRLFNGGEASLVFSDTENPIEGGVDIEARLPGRRRQGLALLSGGERSLTAVALIFALLKVSPTPFCVLDEVDAMLDESNVGRFIELLRDLSKNTQFVVITHNRNTVQAADVIYGVTMGRDSTSQMISLKLEEVDDTYFE